MQVVRDCKRPRFSGQPNPHGPKKHVIQPGRNGWRRSPRSALSNRKRALALKHRLALKPSEYFQRQCWLSIECDEEPAKYAVDKFGGGNIVFSTDYPHGDSKYPESVNSFFKLPLPEDAQRKIMWDNCAALYDIH